MATRRTDHLHRSGWSAIVALALGGLPALAFSNDPPLRILVDPAAGQAKDANETARVASLADAVDYAAKHPPASNTVEITLVPGVHVLKHGVRIGKELGRVVIRGATAGARLVGGVVLDTPRWSAPDAALVARLPDSAKSHVVMLALPPESLTGWSGGLAGPVHSGHGIGVSATRSEVFVGGAALTPARWPNQGFAQIDELVDRGSALRDAADDVPVAERKVEAPRGGVFRMNDKDRLARWANAGDVWALGYWCWDWADEQIPIAKVDASVGTVTLALPHTYGLTSHAKFMVTNLPEELDAPGEYWIDVPRGTIYAWLPGGGAAAECAVSLLSEAMITLDAASNCEISDLTFECSRASAIETHDVRSLVIRDVTFRDLGTRAVALDGRESSVRHCVFQDVGGAGVAISGGDRITLTPAGNSVEDSTFRRCGRVLRTYNPAISISGVGNRAVRNHISDLPHIAITFSGNDHVIEGNDIHDVVLETGDAGAIYTGRDWTAQGTAIRGNLFHSIRGSDARYQNAVYLDDMASGITVEDNLFVHCNWGMLIGGGRDNTIRRNSFVACGKAMYFDKRGVGWMAKHLSDPSTSTLHKTFAAMPVDREPWKSRYPGLASYLTDRFGRPAHGEVSDSFLINTPLGAIDDRECVTEEGTSSETVAPEVIEARCSSLIDQARHAELTVGAAKLGPVGPR
ncbi:MAG: right-handed parallel beta-helix repeat-containing protein [Phycisphaerales bacterium]|jgi:hypothetical protein|nr:right-handed parallel beta-helix repeat-containing protein [Phycisphaerales bacterium]